MNKEQVIQIRVEPTLRKDLQRMADADSRKLADFVRLQLIKIVEENKKKKL
jgi:mRNA-degrading endonuclease RelE of RelBE toxin-antitoxin system